MEEEKIQKRFEERTMQNLNELEGKKVEMTDDEFKFRLKKSIENMAIEKEANKIFERYYTNLNFILFSSGFLLATSLALLIKLFFK